MIIMPNSNLFVAGNMPGNIYQGYERFRDIGRRCCVDQILAERDRHYLDALESKSVSELSAYCGSLV